MPRSAGGNHSDTIRMPTTNPAPTRPSSSRLTTIIGNVWAVANIVHGIDGVDEDRPERAAGAEAVEGHAHEDPARDGEGHVAQPEGDELGLGEVQLVADRRGERREVEPDDEGEEEREPGQVENSLRRAPPEHPGDQLSRVGAGVVIMGIILRNPGFGSVCRR